MSALCFADSQAAVCFVHSQAAVCFADSQVAVCFVHSQAAVCFVHSQAAVCFADSQAAVCFADSQAAVCFDRPYLGSSMPDCCNQWCMRWFYHTWQWQAMAGTGWAQTQCKVRSQSLSRCAMEHVLGRRTLQKCQWFSLCWRTRPWVHPRWRAYLSSGSHFSRCVLLTYSILIILVKTKRHCG